jgi:hypothetical protein
MCGRTMIGLSLSSVSQHNMWSYYENIVIGLSSLSSVSKHNMWWYYVWVCRCRLSVSIYKMWYHDWVYCCFRSSVNTICGRIMIGLSFLSSVSKYKMWSYYDLVYCCCHLSVNTICGRIMVGLIVGFVRQ